MQLGTNSLASEHLARQAELADALRPDVIRVAPSRLDLELPREDLCRGLARAGDDFAAFGCLIALENHFLLAPADLAALVVETGHPNVSVCLDVANSIANQEWPDQTVPVLAPHAGNLHIKDFRFALDPHGVGLSVVGTPLGTGRMDIAMVLDALDAAPRNIDAIVEHWLPRAAFSTQAEANALEREWSRQSITALRQILADRQPEAVQRADA